MNDLEKVRGKSLYQGSHGQGKDREHMILFKGGERSGILYQVREFLNPCPKSVKKYM